MPTASQIEAAKGRGFDRAFTLRKEGLTEINADYMASLLYPDDTERQTAFAGGLRKGWAAGAS
jgi:hypothetical protein